MHFEEHGSFACLRWYHNELPAEYALFNYEDKNPRKRYIGLLNAILNNDISCLPRFSSLSEYILKLAILGGK